MPAYVDTMFSVRQKPWHGLGCIVGDAPNSKAALQHAGLGWEVDQVPVHVNGRPVPRYVANVRRDNGMVLGIVTDRYRVVQNREAFVWTDSLLCSGEVRYETAGALRDGRTVWLLAQINESTQRTILGDEVAPYLLFTNSHDGTAAMRVVITPIRVVCWNTLNYAVNRAKARVDRSWSAAHLIGLNGRLEEAREVLGLAKRYLAGVDEMAEILVNKRISEEQWHAMVDQLIPLPKSPTDGQRHTTNELRADLFARAHAPDLRRFLGTGWAVVNAVADYVAHRPMWDPSQRILVPYANPPKTDRAKKHIEARFSEVASGHPLLDKAIDLILPA